MEFFLLGLTADFETCIVDTTTHNYEMNIQMMYREFRLSVTKKIPIQDQKSLLERNGDDFVVLDGDDLRCFESIFLEATQQRNAEHQLGSHRITYFYSNALVAMPDYTYDPPIPSFPLLIGIEPEHFVEIF